MCRKEFNNFFCFDGGRQVLVVCFGVAVFVCVPRISREFYMTYTASPLSIRVFHTLMNLMMVMQHRFFATSRFVPKKFVTLYWHTHTEHHVSVLGSLIAAVSRRESPL